MKLDFEYNDRSGEYEAEYKGLTIKAVQDSPPESPREWDNVAVMACGHPSYNLGDDDGMRQPRDAIRASRCYRDTWESGSVAAPYDVKIKGTTYDVFDLSEPGQLWQAIQLCDDIESQPLYLYDHSGITISTGRFSCAWDSGQVGFAFVTRAQMIKESAFKRWTPAARAWARERIDAETRVYDDYITGAVYGYVIASDSDDHMDSCWGYYGTDFADSGLAESAMNVADCLLEAAHKKRLACLARLIRNRVPLDKRPAMLASAGELVA